MLTFSLRIWRHKSDHYAPKIGYLIILGFALCPTVESILMKAYLLLLNGDVGRLTFFSEIRYFKVLYWHQIHLKIFKPAMLSG